MIDFSTYDMSEVRKLYQDSGCRTSELVRLADFTGSTKAELLDWIEGYPKIETPTGRINQARLKMVREGYSTAEIARHEGVDFSTMVNWSRSFGIPVIRKGGET